jgi:hypothetical protein
MGRAKRFPSFPKLSTQSPQLVDRARVMAERHTSGSSCAVAAIAVDQYFERADVLFAKTSLREKSRRDEELSIDRIDARE